MIARLKAKGYKVMATATTGKAALLLFGGKTMHSALRIPLNINWDTQPLVDYECFLAEVLRQLDVLIIDEISAGHKNVIHYIDNLLRSVAPVELQNVKYGGKVSNTILFSFTYYLIKDCNPLWRLETTFASGQRRRYLCCLRCFSQNNGHIRAQPGLTASFVKEPTTASWPRGIQQKAENMGHWSWTPQWHLGKN